MRSLISTSLVLLTFMGAAEAALVPSFSPGTPRTFTECMGTPGASQAICEALLMAPNNCEQYHSGDEKAWADCLMQAEATFHRALAQGPANEPYVGEAVPVSTNAADSHYEQQADDTHKGYMQAQDK